MCERPLEGLHSKPSRTRPSPILENAFQSFPKTSTHTIPIAFILLLVPAFVPLPFMDSQSQLPFNRQPARDTCMPIPTSPSQIPDEVWNVFDKLSPALQDRYFNDSEISSDGIQNAELLASFWLFWSTDMRSNHILDETTEDCMLFAGDYVSHLDVAAEKILDLERIARRAFQNNRDKFPLAIWTCCKRRCFASIAIDFQNPGLFEELKTIHSAAEDLHEHIGNSAKYPQTRGKGIGGSSVGYVAPTRSEREKRDGILPGTDRQRALHKLAMFTIEVLPFLSGKEDAPNGTRCPSRKLCTEAICNLLSISRNFLYLRKKPRASSTVSDEELSCLVDHAGIRLRQLRRRGDRTGYPAILDLSSFECGCLEPCLRGSKLTWLKNEYKAFSACSRGLHPRRNENKYLLNVMYSSFTHSPINVCDNALAALYTVSAGHIADVRLALHEMCEDESSDHREFLASGLQGYRKHDKHPINRYPDFIREKIEKHLDMVLRADPAGANGWNTCRVYSPEINTKEKLRKLLGKMLEDDGSGDYHLSDSTLQRMTDQYLRDRNCNIVFTQNDHNACPNCKTMNYAVLEYYHEVKKLEVMLDAEFGDEDQLAGTQEKAKAAALRDKLESKRFQEASTLEHLNAHLLRDASIRKTIKEWSDHFRKVEREYLKLWRQGAQSGLGEWNGLPDHGIITHQDDMTKVDLPHFVVTVSADISRWRFDVNAHVNAVNDECVVFSHEQGTGGKNASAITELILLDHILRCRGEAIKVVVSDNAAVGKNWITTVALPQYMVDQGLADIVFMVFLENNHGKWLADMLFGQLQTKKRRCTMLSVDDLLSGFESINRKSGNVRGFALNPLSAIDFATVFESLGYETTPPKDFGFTKRNIHFAAACTQEAKKRLSPALRMLFGSGLPDHEGMVRISSSPPNHKPRSMLPYDERYFDVPAARLERVSQKRMEESSGPTRTNPSNMPSSVASHEIAKPLVIPLDKEFRTGGQGVVAQNTAKRVGYNGLEFRNQRGNRELQQSSKIVQQAWPKRLLQALEGGSDSGEPVFGSESIKCAPENWIIREPVGHFCTSEGEFRARYPPRNFLNARFGKGPRTKDPWHPVQTYEEPPFPIDDQTAAEEAKRKLANEHQDITRPVDILDLLRTIYSCMEGREDVSDPWLQRRVKIPCPKAIETYRNELRVFIERGKGEPSPPRTLRQFFKDDAGIKARVESLLAKQTNNPKNLKTQLFGKLYEEAENTPGGLDKFRHLVSKDIERYSKAIRTFKQKQKVFDEERGLLPVESVE